MDAAQVELQAAPDNLVLDLPRTAVVVVDMQNDFAGERGMFDRAGIDISVTRRVIVPTQKVLAAARDAGVKIVYLKMAFRPDLSDLGAEDSPNRIRHLRFGVGQQSVAPDGRLGRFLIRDTWNTDIVAELAPKPGDILIYKHRFSGFYETELHDVLQSLGIKTLVFTGCTTSICIDSTIRDAMFRDYRCILLADCSGEPIGGDLARTNHDASLLTVQALFGWVSSSEKFLQATAARNGAASQSAS